MSSTRRTRLVSGVAVVLLPLLPGILGAQVQQQSATPRMLSPTTSNAAAAAEVGAAFERNDVWDFAGALDHAKRAQQPNLRFLTGMSIESASIRPLSRMVTGLVGLLGC